MRKLIAGLAVLAAPYLSTQVTHAETTFVGTWKMDPSTMVWSGKPTELRLSDGMYACPSCTPPVSVKADGAPHPIPGDPYVDAMAVSVVDDHTIRIVDFKNGRQLGVSTFKTSGDGKTLTLGASVTPQTPGGAPLTQTRTYARLTPAPAGAHAVSGTWHRQAITSLSTNAGVITFEVEGNRLRESSPAGWTGTADFDGEPGPVTGNPGQTSVTFHKVSPGQFVETDWFEGKKVDITSWSVSPDGKSLTAVDDYLATGVTMTSTYRPVKLTATAR